MKIDFHTHIYTHEKKRNLNPEVKFIYSNLHANQVILSAIDCSISRCGWCLESWYSSQRRYDKRFIWREHQIKTFPDSTSQCGIEEHERKLQGGSTKKGYTL